MAFLGRERLADAVAPPDPGEVCVPGLVRARAAASPAAVALSAGSDVLTYHELDRRANRLASYLGSLGVGPDVLVGLCLPRSLDLVVGALGILKAGGAYVPMDPSYPPERLALMLEDAQAPVLVTTSCLSQRLPTAKRELVDIGAPQIAERLTDWSPVGIMPGHLAYV